jgi:formate/nitrite transporter FocA (FNT family)
MVPDQGADRVKLADSHEAGSAADVDLTVTKGPVLLGNIVGGTALFALLSYAQVMNEI